MQMILLVDDSLLKELQVAEGRTRRKSMAIKSFLSNLAHGPLVGIVLILEFINVVLELLSKVVNYARPVRKFHSFVS